MQISHWRILSERTFSEAVADDCDFHEADFYWAELRSFVMTECETEGVRFPETIRTGFGPEGVKSPEVQPRPLVSDATTAQVRQKLLPTDLSSDDKRWRHI